MNSLGSWLICNDAAFYIADKKRKNSTKSSSMVSNTTLSNKVSLKGMT